MKDEFDSTKKLPAWVSRIMQDSTRLKRFESDIMIADRERAKDAIERKFRGEPLPASRFPKEIFEPFADAKPLKKQAPIIKAGGGFWVVTSECADVLRKFELGRTSLYPITLLQKDRKTPVEGTYFCLNFGENNAAYLHD